MSTAVELKEQGNRYFSSRNYDDAINCYTKAIIKNPATASFYTNRALCYLKQRKWHQVIADCQHAVDIDPKTVKGHFFMAQAYLELDGYDESISNCKLAYDLAKEQKLNFGDDIASACRQAKLKRWNALEEKRIQQEIELESYIRKLILQDKDRQVALLETDGVDNTEAIEDLESHANKRIVEVNELFTQVDEKRQKREVPDHLCGKISFEIMKDPVITPSGITYDRRHIEEHLQRVGHFDPITRAELKAHQLIPNIAVKEVIDDYLEKNGWAEDY